MRGLHIASFTEGERTTTTTTVFADMNGMRMMVAEPVKEKYALNIGETKWVSVDEENDVFIRDSENGKRAFFSPCRWVKFSEDVPCIDKAVQRAMTLKPTNFKLHIGGGWYVSVNEEVPVVDFRKWYTRVTDPTLRPSPAGISLSYSQWDSLKRVMEQMKADFEDVEPCWHNSELEERRCSECTPGYLFNDSPVGAVAAKCKPRPGFSDSPASPTAPKDAAAAGDAAAMKNIGDAAAADVNVA